MQRLQLMERLESTDLSFKTNDFSPLYERSISGLWSWGVTKVALECLSNATFFTLAEM
jgi:hypothetical protein